MQASRNFRSTARPYQEQRTLSARLGTHCSDDCCGKLQYAVSHAQTRLDASTQRTWQHVSAICALQNMQNLKHLMRYVRGTMDLAMVHRATRDWTRIRGSTDSVDSTPCRTHMFLSFVSPSGIALYITCSTCTHVRVAQDLPRMCCANICTLSKVILSRHVSSDFSSFCSTPPPPKTTSHSRTGIRQTTSTTPRGGLLFDPMAEYNALTDSDRAVRHETRKSSCCGIIQWCEVIIDHQIVREDGVSNRAVEPRGRVL